MSKRKCDPRFEEYHWNRFSGRGSFQFQFNFSSVRRSPTMRPQQDFSRSFCSCCCPPLQVDNSRNREKRGSFNEHQTRQFGTNIKLIVRNPKELVSEIL